MSGYASMTANLRPSSHQVVFIAAAFVIKYAYVIQIRGLCDMGEQLSEPNRLHHMGCGEHAKISVPGQQASVFQNLIGGYR